MKLEWMGPYREMIGDFYRSANGYSQLCKTEMFGDPVRFSPYEVQIMEHILEYAAQHKNIRLQRIDHDPANIVKNNF